jgi:hypothetical protein
MQKTVDQPLGPRHQPAAFTPDDDRQIIEFHKLYGNKWAKMAAVMRTRSCNAIKNRWNFTLAKAEPVIEPIAAPPPQPKEAEH